MKENRNAGFTMIEILIAVAILAILATGTVASFVILDNGNVNTVADDLNSTMSTVRLENMTKSKLTYMQIYTNSDGDYCLKNSSSSSFDASVEGEKLGSRQIKIYYIQSGVNMLVTSTNHLTIEFKRDGSVKYSVAGIVQDNITGLCISNGDKNVNIKVVAATGKHFIE